MVDEETSLKQLLADTAGARLPLPRLQLVWEDRGEDDGLFLSVCHYLLVFPVDRYDIRNLADPEADGGFTAVRMGRTRCKGGSRDTSLITPYRDGCHAKWDAKTLGLPAFVSRGEVWQAIPTNQGEN